MLYPPELRGRMEYQLVTKLFFFSCVKSCLTVPVKFPAAFLNPRYHDYASRDYLYLFVGGLIVFVASLWLSRWPIQGVFASDCPLSYCTKFWVDFKSHLVSCVPWNLGELIGSFMDLLDLLVLFVSCLCLVIAILFKRLKRSRRRRVSIKKGR